MKTETTNLLTEAKNFIESTLYNEIYDTYFSKVTKNISFVVDKSSMKVLVKTDEMKDYNSLFSVRISFEHLREIDNRNLDLYNCLTKLEQKAYLSYQNHKCDNADFMYYDIYEEMFEYSRMFKSSFEKYVSMQAKKMSKQIVELVIEDTEKVISKLHMINTSTDAAFKRVIEERNELKIKRDKLYDFISNKKHLSLNQFQRKELICQLEIMTEYLDCLNRQIEHWFDDYENVDRCTMCGEIVPEGTQVCKNCEKGE